MDAYTIENPPPKVKVDCSRDVPRTKQSFRDECDINVVMARFEATGVLDMALVSRRQAAFGNFAEGVDFLEANLRLLEAREAFGSLPAKVRDRFLNDPARLLDFLSDESNRKEAEELGLISKPVEAGAEGVQPAGSPAAASAGKPAPAPAGKPGSLAAG